VRQKAMTRMATNRPHDEYCWHCDMAEFAGITYAAAHTEAVAEKTKMFARGPVMEIFAGRRTASKLREIRE
jgi:hypothetical protein